MKRFALIGAGGYIAPRHLRAIKDTGHELVVAMDVNDSVGIMDSHFPASEFFTEFEQFEAFVEDERLQGRTLDYVAICSPNYLHTAHMKFALKNGIDVICEKPLVLHTAELDLLEKYEREYGAKVNSILQLRLHPAIIALREKVQAADPAKIFDVELTYLTQREVVFEVLKGFDDNSGVAPTSSSLFRYVAFHFGEVQKRGAMDDKTARVTWNMLRREYVGSVHRL